NLRRREQWGRTWLRTGTSGLLSSRGVAQSLVRRRRQRKHGPLQARMVVWIGGTILIVLSWNDTVSAEVGWVGFVLALIGVGLSFVPHIRAGRATPPGHSATFDKAEVPDAERGAPPDRGQRSGL